MPDSPLEFWVWFCFLALICVSACRLSRRFYWVTAPFALFILYQGWSLLYANNDFSGALLSELGLGYWLQFAVAYALPVVSLAVYGIYDFRFRRRPVA